MEFAEFFRRLWFIGPLIWCACGTIWFIRGRGSVGSILGGIGFLLLFLCNLVNGILFSAERYGDFEYSDLAELAWELLPYANIGYLIGQILILVGMATTKWKTSGGPAVVGAPRPSGYPVSGFPARPGPGDPRRGAPRASAGEGEEDEAGRGEASYSGVDDEDSSHADGGHGGAPHDEDRWGSDRSASLPAGSGPYPPPRPPGPGYGPPPYANPPYLTATMGPPAPLYRPGWAIPGSWIALSCLAWLFGIVGLVLLLDAGGRISDSEWTGILISYALWFLTGVPAIILFFVWMYRSWAAVPPEYRSTSPGRAVGFMFIPFFNLYWVFRAIPGLSASTRRAQLAMDPSRAGGAAFGIGIAACVVGLIPYIGILSWFFFLIWVILATGDTNRLLRSRIEREA